jgi:hypothetical protein
VSTKPGAAQAFEYAPQARVGLASEGCFGPHPFIPFLAIGRELVLLIRRASWITSPSPRRDSQTCARLDRLGFPCRESAVPNLGLHEVIIEDPSGVTFDLNNPATEAR